MSHNSVLSEIYFSKFSHAFNFRITWALFASFICSRIFFKCRWDFSLSWDVLTKLSSLLTQQLQSRNCKEELTSTWNDQAARLSCPRPGCLGPLVQLQQTFLLTERPGMIHYRHCHKKNTDKKWCGKSSKLWILPISFKLIVCPAEDWDILELIF